VVHFCNPSFCSGEDQEDCGLGQPGQKIFKTSYQPIKSWDGGVYLSYLPALLEA
jgi:hypothetical protein